MIDTIPAFAIKGGLVTFTSIQLYSCNLADIKHQLDNKIRQAPAFFKHAPIIIDVHRLSLQQQKSIDLLAIRQILTNALLIPIAIQGAQKFLEEQAVIHGLAILSAPQTKIREESKGTKVIRTPVRSGQQVYAPHGDLLVLASVSAGAELLADGHIYVMGALRGRALAGINGNTEATIFCKSLEADLISIAGHYKLSEDFKDTLWKQAVRIEYRDGHLTIIDF